MKVRSNESRRKKAASKRMSVLEENVVGEGVE